ncbi:MAG: hypothetical protein ACFCVD_04330 [Nodosilinea sp.]
MTNFYSGEGINTGNDANQKLTDWVSSTEIGNFEASGWTSTGEVASFLREILPPTHLENCRNIQYESKPNAEYSNAVGTFDCKSREIIIGESIERLPDMEDRIEPLTLQIAYNSYENVRVNRPDLLEQWSELHDQSLERNNQDGLGFVSSRANKDVCEDFAETYTTYLHDPERLKFYSPEKYEFMRQEVFSAREYPAPVLSNITHSPNTRLNFGSRTSVTKEAENRLPVAFARAHVSENAKIDAVAVVENRLPKPIGAILPPMPKGTIQRTEQMPNSIRNPDTRKS